MKKFLKEYRIELIALALALLGVFLLVERLEIRASIRRGLTWLADSSVEFLGLIRTRLQEWITSFTPSDLLGWSLLVGMLILIIWRVRYRFLRSSYWKIKTCPRCDSELLRIHRTRVQRLLAKSILPHARRYRCSNEDCGWSGLRHRIRYRHPSHASSDGRAEEITHHFTQNQGE